MVAITFQPFPEKSWAVALPIPEEAPVIKIVLLIVSFLVIQRSGGVGDGRFVEETRFCLLERSGGKGIIFPQPPSFPSLF